MNSIYKDKLYNVINYIAKAYRKKTSRYIPQMILYKMLAWIDVESVKKIGVPVFDLNYIAMERGPVPEELYSNRENLKTDLFRFFKGNIINGNITYRIKAEGKADLDCFSDFELDIIDNTIDIFAEKDISTEIASESSHEITSWRKAWNRCHNSRISLTDEFNSKKYENIPIELKRLLDWEYSKSFNK